MKMLKRFQARARLQKEPGAKPYLREKIILPDTDVELFYDVETDPMRDVCYLHGFLERRGEREKYVHFSADRPDAENEEAAFRNAWDYIQSSLPCSLYYYSHYEKTIMRKLARRYPAVASEDQVVALFDSEDVIDLFGDVVRPKTEWPTYDLSIKTLASYLGFRWRDTEPSGAASIEWYNTWVQTGDHRHKTRILEYNQDDCVATRVLLDAIRKFDIVPDGHQSVPFDRLG
jgi:predicted RecB family nuclease